MMGFEFAPARGSPVSVIDHVMTSKHYKKIEHVGTWLLISSFAKFRQIQSDSFFQFLSCFILPDYKGIFNFCN